MTPADLRQALPLFDEFVARFAPLLGDDARPQRAHAYLRGLLLDNDDNKTAEALALAVYGDPSQVRMMQVFVSQSPWDDAPLRQELIRQVDAELGRDDGVLIFDESSFPKCGPKSVGVARQYCGALGKVANCQVAAYVAYASDAGHTLLDTRLYLHDSWTDDPDRCRRAGVPEGVVFRTKPQLAFELLLACREHIRHSWVTFDEVYGRDPDFVSGLEELASAISGRSPRTRTSGCSGRGSRSRGRAAGGRRGKSRGWRPGSRRRRRWRKWPDPCPPRRGGGWGSGRGPRGGSTRSSPGCGWWRSGTTCRGRNCGW